MLKLQFRKLPRFLSLNPTYADRLKAQAIGPFQPFQGWVSGV